MALNDKRHFSRYKKTAVFVLESDRKKFKSGLLDYCLNGIGAVVAEGAPLKEGDIVKVLLREPYFNATGKIIWTDNSSGVLRVGIGNIGPLNGRIEDFRLSDTLIGLQRTMMTGILTFESGDIVKRVYIRNGDMVFAASNQNEDRLGDVLVREEVITPGQYEHSVEEMKKTGKRQGTCLVRLGYLRPDELVAAVRFYVEEIIRSLFLLKKGRFLFEESPLPTQEVITLKLSAANLIYSGVKKAVTAGYFDSELPPIDCTPCFSADPLNLFQDIKLDITGKRTVLLIDGKTSLGDIMSIARLDSLEVRKTLYALMSARVVEIADDREPSAEIPREVIEETFGKGPVTEMPIEVREMIEHMHGNCESLGYYGVLGVEHHAPLSEIRRAYYRAAKKFHPDIHFLQADDSIKQKLSDIFSYIYKAYSTLSNPQTRAEYDRLSNEKAAEPAGEKDRARAHFEQGRTYFNRRNYQKAEHFFGQAAYLDTAASEYHHYYGLALMKQCKPRKAARALETALLLDPFNTTYLADLGFICLDLGFPRRAEALFKKALSKSPDHSRSLEGLGKIRMARSGRR